jgi:hypothetical protein
MMSDNNIEFPKNGPGYPFNIVLYQYAESELYISIAHI